MYTVGAVIYQALEEDARVGDADRAPGGGTCKKILLKVAPMMAFRCSN